MKRIILVAALLCSACGTTVVNKPVPIDIPVIVKCHAPVIVKPIFISFAITKDSPFFDQAKAIIATNEQRKGYEAQLIAANNSCQ